ncbi:HK97 gp10 family phage protein [Thermoanaerobacterium thermosaccharolyticum]|uniref:HK97-gp10 family putative phage morphogenesis protein n=1 Tax=Thermoanaerobacterium thermosaccharolyticum TaxID=1517 RepID=UPI003D269FE1
MAENFTVEVIGSKEILFKLRSLEEASSEILEKAASSAAEVVKDAASKKAPRRTGKLARSMVYKTKEKSKTGVEIVIGPDKDAFYGLFHEYGTSKMPAHPFLRPALDENGEKIKRTIANKLKSILK